MNHVVALALVAYSPLIVLKADATVFRMGFRKPGTPPTDQRTIAFDMAGEISHTPYDFSSADPVILDGQALTNVVALSSGGGHALALKRILTWIC